MNTLEIKRKVLAYITVGTEDKQKLLVFEQKGRPDAGLQVPGGTIEEDELLIDALYREVEEETGIPRELFQLEGKVSKTKYYPEDKNELIERNIFHLRYLGEVKERWEHQIVSKGKDNGLIFCFHWEPIQDLPKLARKQDQVIDYIES